jgi:hypothetical protein
MYPVLSRIPVELQQHLGIVDDLRDRFRILRVVIDLERLDRDLRPVDVFGVEDLPHRRERARMRRLRQRGKHIRLQRGREHPPGSIANNLIQQRTTRIALIGRIRVVNYREHGRTFPTTASTPVLIEYLFP